MWQSLSDPDFRKQLIAEHIDVGIAFQIRSLRNRQKLTQTDLAELLGDKSKQPMISGWENPNYRRYTLATLKELAKAFDVGLLVRFVPFSQLVDWTVDLTSDVIAPPSFSEEPPPIAAPVPVASTPTSGFINLGANSPDVPSLDRPAEVTYPSTATTGKELAHVV